MQQALFFLLPSSRVSRSSCASRKMPRSPRLAHKAPVMQASLQFKNDRIFWYVKIHKSRMHLLRAACWPCRWAARYKCLSWQGRFSASTVASSSVLFFCCIYAITKPLPSARGRRKLVLMIFASLAWKTAAKSEECVFKRRKKRRLVIPQRTRRYVIQKHFVYMQQVGCSAGARGSIGEGRCYKKTETSLARHWSWITNHLHVNN